MIKKPLLNILILSLISLHPTIAQEANPIIVSPLIGKKLDRIERNYFNLFPHFEGFEEAVFYVNPDSSLRAAIKYYNDEGIKDTIIERYRSVRDLRYHISWVVKHPEPPSENARKGSTINVLLNTNRKVIGELVETGTYHLQLFNPEYNTPGKQDMGSSGYTTLRYPDIGEIKLVTTSNISPVVFGTIGGLAGLLIAITQTKETSGRLDLGKGFYTAIGMSVGALISLFIPIEVKSESILEPPFNKNEIKELRNKTKVY